MTMFMLEIAEVLLEAFVRATRMGSPTSMLKNLDTTTIFTMILS